MLTTNFNIAELISRQKALYEPKGAAEHFSNNNTTRTCAL